jgi:hypothetical protein
MFHSVLPRFDHLTENEQHKHIIKLQTRWAADALNDARYNKKQALAFEKSKMLRSEQHARVTKQERDWATLASNDAVYAQKEARRFRTLGKDILADMYQQEHDWCVIWSNKRRKLADMHNMTLSEMYWKEYEWSMFWYNRRKRIIDDHRELLD